MSEKGELNAPYKKGVDIPLDKADKAWGFVVEKGKEILQGTAFMTGEAFTEKDIDYLKKYYQEVFDFQEKELGTEGAVFNKSLMEHLLLAERIGSEAAPILGIDVYKLDAVLLTHDFGRIFSHRRGRNNVIERTLSGKIGFSESFTNLLPQDTLWTNIEDSPLRERLNKMTTEGGGIAAAVELIDVLAKWGDKANGKLRKWESVVSSARAGQHLPNKNDMWPSEYKRQIKITSDTGNEMISTKYEFLKNWFETKTSLSLNQFIERVEKGLQSEPLREGWN